MIKKILIALLVLVIIGGAGVYIFRKQVLALAANGADVVLRPLIGSENTLWLESLVFNAQDKVNQLHSTAPTSVSSIFNDTASSSAHLSGNMPLPAIAPLTHLPALQDEGVWQPMAFTQQPSQLLMARTVVQVDNARPYAYVALVKMDMTQLKLGIVAGLKQPGGPVGNPGPGVVPDAVRASNGLLAAFDGGFQYRDGQYGMIVGTKTYLPLQKDLASLFINDQGQVKIMNYEGQALSPDIIAVRQNGPLLLDKGQLTPFTEASKDTWGRTVTNSIYTWRSGIGVTADGDVIFAVGPSLRPQTLALALQAAGATEAMQLDINPYWVRFVTFQSQNNGTYVSTSLLKNMENGGYSYLHGYQKDFFYVYLKQ